MGERERERISQWRAMLEWIGTHRPYRSYRTHGTYGESYPAVSTLSVAPGHARFKASAVSPPAEIPDSSSAWYRAM